MPNRLFPILICVGLVGHPAFADATCPWAGGVYSFSQSGVYGEITVNEDCTQIIWKRRKEPETATLARTRNGWKGRLERADVELLENGRSLRISEGGVMRQTTAKPKN